MIPAAATTADATARAQALGHALPPLLAEAEVLAATLSMGEHGRKRAGQGDAFWQFRPAQPGDAARAIDWRRSARGDGAFVREQEWQVAQAVTLWVDRAASMTFTGDADRPSKGAVARLVALALAVALLRGGEKVGLAASLGAQGAAHAPPRAGRGQVMTLAQLLEQAPDDPAADHGLPQADAIMRHGRAVFLSDFMGPIDGIAAAMAQASERGARGVLIHLLDPVEETFPFHGRTLFQSMAGGLRVETQSADDLRARYLARLAERKDALAGLCRQMGWHYGCHHTGPNAALTTLIWAYRALEGAGLAGGRR